MYPTDLTETQWQFIKKTLEFDERKRKNSLRVIWNAINYLVKTGCQWRMLPKDLPKWQLVYYYYCKWTNLEHFDLLLSKLREKVRFARGQNAMPSLGIMDSQSVRWGNNRVANIDDSKAAGLLMRTLHYFLCPIKAILADSGYRGEAIESIKNKFGYIIQVVMRSDDRKTGFKPIHKRWVVERTFAWFDNDRRLCRNYELLLETSENMVKIATIKLLWNKI
jgi:putative transposase